MAHSNNGRYPPHHLGPPTAAASNDSIGAPGIAVSSSGAACASGMGARAPTNRGPHFPRGRGPSEDSSVSADDSRGGEADEEEDDDCDWDEERRLIVEAIEAIVSMHVKALFDEIKAVREELAAIRAALTQSPTDNRQH